MANSNKRFNSHDIDMEDKTKSSHTKQREAADAARAKEEAAIKKAQESGVMPYLHAQDLLNMTK